MHLPGCLIATGSLSGSNPNGQKCLIAKTAVGAGSEGADSLPVVAFIEGMRPDGEVETPRWIEQLLLGDLQCGREFWR